MPSFVCKPVVDDAGAGAGDSDDGNMTVYKYRIYAHANYAAAGRRKVKNSRRLIKKGEGRNRVCNEL